MFWKTTSTKLFPFAVGPSSQTGLCDKGLVTRTADKNVSDKGVRTHLHAHANTHTQTRTAAICFRKPETLQDERGLWIIDQRLANAIEMLPLMLAGWVVYVCVCVSPPPFGQVLRSACLHVHINITGHACGSVHFFIFLHRLYTSQQSCACALLAFTIYV